MAGNLFWHITGGVFAAVLTLLLCFSALRWSFTARRRLAAVPLTLSLLYVFGLRQGKPRGYDRLSKAYERGRNPVGSRIYAPLCSALTTPQT